MTKLFSAKRGAKPAKYVQSSIWIPPHTHTASIRRQCGDEISVQLMQIVTLACDLKKLLVLLLKHWHADREPVGLLYISGVQ